MSDTSGIEPRTPITAASLPSGIDATKIGAGTVNNTEFGYLDGVTSNIQTQLNAKQPLDADLTAIAALSTTGTSIRTGANTWALAPLIATSGAMPGTPQTGQTVFVTDLGMEFAYDGSAWVSSPFVVDIGGLNGPAADLFGVWYADQYIGPRTIQTSVSTAGGAVGAVAPSGLSLRLSKLHIIAESAPGTDKTIDFYRLSGGTWSAEVATFTVPAGSGLYEAEMTGLSFTLAAQEALVPHNTDVASWICGGLKLSACGRYVL